MLARVLVLLSAAVVGTADAPDAPRQPTGKWIVDFDQPQCVAQRNYGTAEDPLYLILKQPPLGDVMQVAISNQRPAGKATEQDGRIEFDGQESIKVSVVAFQPLGSKLRTRSRKSHACSVRRGQDCNQRRISTRGLNERLALAEITPLLKIMDECVQDLRDTWHAHEEGSISGGLAKEANGNLQGLFRGDDYPADALHNDQSGTVAVALLIDERGAVADCSIIGTSNVAILDAQTCILAKKRAKFRPAVGRDGKPAKDAFIQRITWRLEH